MQSPHDIVFTNTSFILESLGQSQLFRYILLFLTSLALLKLCPLPWTASSYPSHWTPSLIWLNPTIITQFKSSFFHKASSDPLLHPTLDRGPSLGCHHDDVSTSTDRAGPVVLLWNESSVRMKLAYSSFTSSLSLKTVDFRGWPHLHHLGFCKKYKF